ncbi:uncharacterized protein FIBRA_08886 [Fibroporia radiculosa]|uniref:Uncharacterized protein n=1 Tax=Fibroporia radiculosa TaxID=599839 RepID=J4I3G9_9APHY|nr:uncharacterized protein FIBRA_08886 [Fibroporia radiculosa]CCM06607.1 predicted protein [Fibroporia radiculosa]
MSSPSESDKSSAKPSKKSARVDSAQSTSDINRLQRPRENDIRPSLWKRIVVILTLTALFLLALTIRARLNRPPRVIYASRYSKEHKYRPAASPIITETLKDGRIRLRGAMPTGL